MGSAEEVPEQVRFSPRLRWLLRALGMGPKRTGLVLTSYEVRVKAGGFQTTVPLDHIVAVSECPAPWWAQAGVHTDFRGRWIINGGPGRLVRLGLSPSVEARIWVWQPRGSGSVWRPARRGDQSIAPSACSGWRGVRGGCSILTNMEQ